MKNFFKKLLVAGFLAVIAMSTANAVTPTINSDNNLWHGVSNGSIFPLGTTTEICSSGQRCTKIWADEIDATSIVGLGSLGAITIDITDPEAFLVRKDGDAGDVFVIDSNTGKVGIGVFPPTYTLDIAGDLRITATTNQQFIYTNNSPAEGTKAFRIEMSSASGTISYSGMIAALTSGVAKTAGTTIGFESSLVVNGADAGGAYIGFSASNISTSASTQTAYSSGTGWDKAMSIGEGGIFWEAGKSVTASSYSIIRDADATNQLHFNIPTGASMEWSVNDVNGFKLLSNNTIQVGNTVTGLGGEQFGVQSQGASTVPIQVSIHASQTAPSFRIRTAAQADLVVFEKFGALTMTPGIQTSGVPYAMKITRPANTGMTASTISPGFIYEGSATQTWATGAISQQSEFIVTAPTYAFAGASSIDVSSTVLINQAPLAGANATLNYSAALIVGDPSGWVGNALAGTIAELIVAPGISDGVGNTELLAGLTIAGSVVGGNILVGNQTATTDDFALVYTPTIRLESDTLTRTFTQAAGIIVKSLEATSTVEFTDGPYAGIFIPQAGFTPTASSTPGGIKIKGAVISFEDNVNITSTPGPTMLNIEQLLLSNISGAAMTVDRASGIYIADAPTIQGGNITLTDSWSVWVDNGLSRFDGGLAIEGSTTKNVIYGTYTPTRSAEANMDGNVTMTEAQYIRLGNTVTVSGRFTADPTLAATGTSFEITLPVASNIGAAEDAAGVAFSGTIAGMGAEAIGVAANDTAKIQWVSSDINSNTWSYTFTYQVI